MIPGAGNLGRFQYTGQAWLPELGMYTYKARIYSPTLGRFLQTDPIGYDDQFNLYAYVGNDPVNGTDPSGLAECDTGSRLEGGSSSCKVADGYTIEKKNKDGTLGKAVQPVEKGVGKAKDVVTVPFRKAGEAAGAAGDFKKNYDDMRDANTIGGDKYFHCKANCEAASRGSTGQFVAGKSAIPERSPISGSRAIHVVRRKLTKQLIDKAGLVGRKRHLGACRRFLEHRIEQTRIFAALHVALFALAGYPMNIEDGRTMKKLVAFAVLGLVLLGLGYVLWDYLIAKKRSLDLGYGEVA